MNILISIPKEVYKGIIGEGNYSTDFNLIKAFQNGTPIPDNATNGDMIKAMFPKAYVDESRYETPFIDVMYEGELKSFSETWWNAPYQKGGINRKNCEYRHENGNCLKVGGFCTSVDDEHCMKGGKR